MQDICREAGVSAGAVYVYFDSKEALIEGIVARDREDIADALRAVGVAPDFFAALEAALRVCVLERPRHKAALFIEIIAEAHRNPRVAQSLSRCDSELRGLLKALVEGARAEGRIPPGLSADKLALMMAMMGDALFMRRAGNPSFDGAELVPVIVETMRRLIGGGDIQSGATAPAKAPRLHPIHAGAL